MSVSITKTLGDLGLWVKCPKSEMGNPHLVQVKEWGKQKCCYEKCDGHEFDVEFNFENAMAMLKDVEKRKEPTRIESKAPTGRLQKMGEGSYIWVIQS